MSVATKAVVLSSLRYGDSSLIVRAYTRAAGLQSFLLKGILKQQKGRLRSAMFQPLTQLEVVTGPLRPGKLGYLKEARISVPYATLHTDIRKSTIALFLSEVLTGCIREEEANPELFSYLEHTLQWLDHHSNTANFHIRFLLGLSRYLGFYPDCEASQAAYFDLAEGAFCTAQPLNPVISGRPLEQFRAFLGINFDAIDQVKMTQAERRDLLRLLVIYYELHVHGFKKPRSLTVLDEVFS